MKTNNSTHPKKRVVVLSRKFVAGERFLKKRETALSEKKSLREI